MTCNVFGGTLNPTLPTIAVSYLTLLVGRHKSCLLLVFCCCETASLWLPSSLCTPQTPIFCSSLDVSCCGLEVTEPVQSFYYVS